MRLLDIATAALIGFSSISALLYWDPAGTDLAAHRFEEQARLRDSLVSFVGTRGLAWFQDANSTTVCSNVNSLSNSTFGFSASVRSVTCSPTQPLGASGVNVTIETGEGTVVLEAWALG